MTLAETVLEYVKALAWPITALSIALLFRRQLIGIFGRLRKADLPGGVSLDFEKEVAEVKQLSEEVEPTSRPPEKKDVPAIPLTEANARLLSLGLQPSPSGIDMSYYRSLANQDANLALAGLRIEIDVLARNLAKGFGIEIGERDYGGRLLRKLYENRAITANQLQLTQKVLRLCNAAVHGSPVSKSEADAVIDSAEVLADQYLAWLSWGFDDDWKATTKE
jgi:hypothetical protein